MTKVMGLHNKLENQDLWALSRSTPDASHACGLLTSARIFAGGVHAVAMVDQAGWPMSQKLNIPSNNTLLMSPPLSLGQNPDEKVLQVMCYSCLSNQIDEPFDGIVPICCDAWNKFIGRLCKIISIGISAGRTGSHQRKHM